MNLKQGVAPGWGQPLPGLLFICNVISSSYAYPLS
jgi:hypothetical protein